MTAMWTVNISWFLSFFVLVVFCVVYITKSKRQGAFM